MRHLKFELMILALAAFAVAGCDPLAPRAPRAVVVTQAITPIRPTINTTAVALADVQAATAAPTLTLIPPTEAATATEPPTATATVTPLPTLFVCTQTKGQVLDLTLTSRVARTNLPYRVYVPPCYAETQRRYPFVILMHGSDKDQNEWTELHKANLALETGLANGTLPPMILVMPYGGNLANTNTFVEGASWESVVVRELLPDVQKNFCTWNDRAGRAIGGISRGGFWSWSIGLRRPELFGAVAGHSPFFDQTNAPATHNPMGLVKTIKFGAGLQPRLWMDAGKNDYVLPNMILVQQSLEERKIDFTLSLDEQGRHEVKYWSSRVGDYLSFYGQPWPRDVNELPSCLQ